MRRQLRTRDQPALSRLLLTVAALGLLMLPLDYRGGAEVEHPHAIFQLWFDAAHGTIDHHQRRIEHEGSSSHQPRHATGHPAVADTAAPDVPQLTEAASTIERPPMIVASLAVLALALLLVRAIPLPSLPMLLAGLHPRPQTPPPRLAAAPA